MSDQAEARKYEHDTPIRFWLSMPGNHTAKESDTNTIGEWIGVTAEEFAALSDGDDDAAREWISGLVEWGWHPERDA